MNATARRAGHIRGAPAGRRVTERAVPVNAAVLPFQEAPGVDQDGHEELTLALREQLHVLVAFAPIDFVIDAVVGEVHLATKERQIVLARPVADLVLVAVRSAVAVGAVAVLLRQELLVLAFQA